PSTMSPYTCPPCPCAKHLSKDEDRVRLLGSSSPILEAGGALGAEGADAFGEVGGGGDQRAGDRFDGAVALLALGQRDHLLGDLEGRGPAGEQALGQLARRA